jgi:hypothetical protein
LSIVKPSTNLLANKTTSALITKRKRPMVIIVTGNVNKIKSGLINIFNNASTIANTTAVQKSVICTPVSKRDNPKETAATTKTRIRKFICQDLTVKLYNYQFIKLFRI